MFDWLLIFDLCSSNPHPRPPPYPGRSSRPPTICGGTVTIDKYGRTTVACYCFHYQLDVLKDLPILYHTRSVYGCRLVATVTLELKDYGTSQAIDRSCCECGGCHGEKKEARGRGEDENGGTVDYELRYRRLTFHRGNFDWIAFRDWRREE